ncbi:MAG: hypothetical protein E6J91_01240 [Deltaproteobacteria bacterium]|nr:MAG: hypothetical protein E6J91_01240 [Deltaproteobacteria bacterium]
MNTLRSFTCAVLALGAFAIAGCSSDSSASGSLRVQNNSDFAIVEIHVAPVGSTSWGPNLISGDTLNPGEQLTVDISCGTYDALLVDESGVDCQLQSVDLCLNIADWIIRNNTCTVFGSASQDQAVVAVEHAEPRALDLGRHAQARRQPRGGAP